MNAQASQRTGRFSRSSMLAVLSISVSRPSCLFRQVLYIYPSPHISSTFPLFFTIPTTSSSDISVLISSALDDIKASINELKYYRDNVFPPIEPRREKSDKQDTESEGVRKTAI